MSLIINPGSGPVAGATETNAWTNIRHFQTDLELAGHRVEDPIPLGKPSEDGRWGYLVHIDDQRVEVDMPGLPLHAVRWMNEPSQNIWDYPRLYVNGSSWVWYYALNACKTTTTDRR